MLNKLKEILYKTRVSKDKAIALEDRKDKGFYVIALWDSDNRVIYTNTIRAGRKFEAWLTIKALDLLDYEYWSVLTLPEDRFDADALKEMLLKEMPIFM